MNARSVDPGEPIFLQGQLLQEFYGVRDGRFALVRMNKSSAGLSQSEFLAQATLVDIVTYDQIFGELGALLAEPQPFSVFALEAGTIQTLSTSGPELNAALGQNPLFAVKTCVSLAGHLKAALDQFAMLVKECELIDQAIRDGARSFLAMVDELEREIGQQPGELARFARAHKAFTGSKSIILTNPEVAGGTSVNSAVIDSPSNSIAPVSFPAGAQLCRKGCLGDRLFVIVEGIVEVVLGGGATVTISRPGSVIGEIAVFLNLARPTSQVRRTADVVCVTPVKAIVVGMDRVEAFFASQTDLMTAMLSAIVFRTKETRQLLSIFRNRLHWRLREELRPLLEGHHELARKISECEGMGKLHHSFESAASQTRLIYDRFATALQTMKKIVP